MADMAGVNGGSFLNTIPAPEAGQFITGASVQQVAQGAANQDKFLYDTKGNLAGGNTWTGNQVFNSGTFTVSGARGVALTGTQPDPDADPGANNIAIGVLQCKAWGNIFVNTSVSVLDAINVASVSISGNQTVEIVFARAMANAFYSVVYGIETLSTGLTILSVAQPFTDTLLKTATGFCFGLGRGANLLDPSSVTATRVQFHVMARQ